MRSLRDQFDPRHNNFDVIRLLLAGLVAVVHGIVMRTGDQPYLGDTTLGDLGVDGFFVLSGFLITRSYLSLSSFPRFVWHRVLRIMPGFWVCLLVVALIVAPLASVIGGRPWWQPFVQPPSVGSYLLGNAGLLITHYRIGDVFAANPTPYVVNGSLWTLALEALCYAVVGALGLIGLLRRRWSLPVLAALVWALMLLQELKVPLPLGDQTLRLTLMFLIGASAYLYADRVPTHLALAVGAGVLVVASTLVLPNYRLVGAVPFAYALLWLSTCLPRTVRLPNDLSYGVYIYHWPLLQILAMTALVRAPVAVFVAVGLLVVVPAAWCSWYGVERRSLARKHNPLPDRVAARVLRRRLPAPRQLDRVDH